ncbi:MAG: MBL fold metallo-hydrolase [Chloroflexota bacterium]
MLEIVPLMLGLVETNAYLVADTLSGEAAVIDPAWDGEKILAAAEQRGWRITNLWFTHAHFDHLGGAAALARGLPQPPVIALHPADRPLWDAQGGAPFFGLHIETPPAPGLALAHGQTLALGQQRFEVRHAPGHTPGHVVFYSAGEGVLFCGDVIFAGSIGRTDLPGGSLETLLHSIRTQVLSLPAETRLLSGHGPQTTVAAERRYNPFLN